MGPKKIILTGGPGGGKSTAADLISRELKNIFVVPEAASILFAGGFPRMDNDAARKATQTAIYHVQKNMEDVQSHCYPNHILLCDRGTVDGAAYWPDGTADFFEQMQTSLKHELSRYHAVIFFESAAVGGYSIDSNNPLRTENHHQAIELDRRLRQLWSEHESYIHIPHQDSFFSKLTGAVDVIKELLK